MKTLLAVFALLILTACGQTGPLRLPEPKDAATAPADATPADKPKPSPTP